MRSAIVAIAALLALPAFAQTRQPAQITTQPTVTPQPFELLDKTGTWIPLGAAPGGAAGTDVRAFGCKADGTDQTACINAALAASGCVLIPASTNGFTVNGTITVNKCLRGEVWQPSTAAIGNAGSSFIKCANTSSTACVAVEPAGGTAVQIQNISIIGATATPSGGSIGLHWKGGYNLALDHVQVANFDTCVYTGPSKPTGSRLSMHSVESMFSRCRVHYVVLDGTPEAYFIGGRWGENGGADYDSAEDFVYNTKTAAGSGGAGPNTLIIDTVQINPGGHAVGCAFRWGGFTGSGGVGGANKIVNSHIEVFGNAYTGSNPQRGYFCYDSTVPIVQEMKVIGSSFLDDSSPKILPLFNIDPAVTFGNDSRLTIIGNAFHVGPFSIGVKGLLFHFGPTFIGNFFFNLATFNAVDVNARAMLSDNIFFNGYAISGVWQKLALSNNSGVLTDTATGSVYAAGYETKPWTPILAFSGASTGITYTTQVGNIQRVSGGGFRAAMSIVLSSKGSASGVASISGLPWVCASSAAGYPPTAMAGMAGLTGAPIVQMQVGVATAVLAQASATGTAALTDANFTNTSQIDVVIECGRAQ